MPDNQQNMKYIFQTEFDPRGVDAAQKGIDGMTSAFNALGSQVERTNFGRAMQSMQQFEGILPNIARAGEKTAKGVVNLTKAAAGLRNEIASVDAGVTLLKNQFSTGIIDKRAFQEGMSSFRAVKSELQGLSAEAYANRDASKIAMDFISKEAAESREELEKMGVPMRLFRSSIQGSSIDVEKLHNKIRVWGRDPAPQEVARYAKLYNNILVEQRVLQNKAEESRQKLNDAMSFKGAVAGAAKNMRKAVVQPFKDAIDYVQRIPTLLSEGVKDGLGTAFSARGVIGGAAMGMVKRVFNKKTLGRAMAFGPLGALSGMLSKPKEKDERGYVSGGGGGGPLGALGKSLSSFGGILGLATKALAPMALLMKILTPVLQTLSWVLEPLIAPLQQLLSDAVLQFVPFLSDIAGLFAELATEMMPVLTEMVQALGPVLVELARTILPPLIKMLKLSITWFTNIATMLGKVLTPILGWLGEKIFGVAEMLVGVFSWLGKTLLELPLVGWALKKMGFSSAAMTPSQSATDDAGQTQAPLPGVNAQGAGVAGPAMAMSITEAGGASAFKNFTEPRGVAEPIRYNPGTGQMQSNLSRKIEAMRIASEERPGIVDKPDPDELSAPVVAAIKRMTHSLLTILPKRIGQQTKVVSLADFSAVTV